jgi:hypothetical protein
VNAPTAVEIEAIAVSYRGWLDFDGQNQPSAEAKKHLKDIENTARKQIKAIEGANDRARDAVAMRIGEALDGGLGLLRSFDHSVPRGRDVLAEMVRLQNMLSKAASDARKDIPRSPVLSAQRMAACDLCNLFSKHGLKFSATADEYGGTSRAVAALLDIARRAGDAAMTIDAARKWVEFAKRETIGKKIDDGFPIS